MKLSKNRMTVLVLSALCIHGAAAMDAPPEEVPPNQNVRPMITEAHVDSLSGVLTIVGHGFSPVGSTELRVWLGGPQGVGEGPGEITAPCTATPPTNNVITCDLGIIALSPGDYLLTVQTGQGRFDDFPVAFGEVGPQGATGEKGDKGDVGDTGATGDEGATGDKGAKGDPGAQGSPGGGVDTSKISPRQPAGFTDKKFCPNPTDLVIGGGGVCKSDSRRAVIDRPIFNPPGWEFNCSEAGQPDDAQQVWVTCVAQ